MYILHAWLPNTTRTSSFTLCYIISHEPHTHAIIMHGCDQSHFGLLLSHFFIPTSCLLTILNVFPSSFDHHFQLNPFIPPPYPYLHLPYPLNPLLSLPPPLFILHGTQIPCSPRLTHGHHMAILQLSCNPHPPHTSISSIGSPYHPCAAHMTTT